MMLESGNTYHVSMVISKIVILDRKNVILVDRYWSKGVTVIATPTRKV